VEKKEPSYPVDGNVNWCSHCRKRVWRFLKKLKIKLPYDPAILLLGIYLKKAKTLIQKYTYSPVFTAALFTITKKWKQVSKNREMDKRGCRRYIYITHRNTAAAKSLQSCPTLCDPIDGTHQAPPSLGFSRQEHWRGLPFPSPMHEGEKWKWSRSVLSDSERPHGLQPTRLLRPRHFPGKSTGMGCHCLLYSAIKKNETLPFAATWKD